MKRVKTYWAKIYVGTSQRRSPPQYEDERIYNTCSNYVDRVGLCVTVTKTDFIYTYGIEAGYVVGLINYPRFPSTPQKIRKHAVALAKLLKKELGQKRVSIVFPDDTIMLGSVKD